jgi:hypothetical protein
MNDKAIAHDEILTGLAQEVDKVVQTKAALKAAGVSPGMAVTVSSAQAAAVADQIVHRAAAAMADVHAHAMARVASMRVQLDELEKTIVAARENSERHMQKFMALCADGEECIQQMEKAVHRVNDHLYSGTG